MLIEINYANLKSLKLALRALDHKLRKEIIKLIAENPQITVTEIYVKLRVEQSVASQQLAILKKSQIVTATREGKFIKYEINTEEVKRIDQLASEFVTGGK